MDYYLVFNNEMVGSRVIISDKILSRKTHQYRELNGKKGIVDSVWDDNIGVKIDGLTNTNSKQGIFYFKSNELIIDSEEENNMANENYENYKGHYVVAKIHYVDDVANAETFARLYDDDGMFYEVGGYVVAKSVNKCMRVAKIIDCFDENSMNSCSSDTEIICPIQMEAYNKRNQKVKEIKKLKAAMDEKVKELQGIALYKLMAQESPELKEMFEKFTELTKTNTNNN